MKSFNNMKVRDKYRNKITQEEVEISGFVRFGKSDIKIGFFGNVNKHRQLNVSQFQKYFRPI